LSFPWVTVWLFADIFNWGKTPTSEWGNTNFTDVKLSNNSTFISRLL